jgi:hypothetical protein
MDGFLPQVRVTDVLRLRLELVVERSLSKTLSDHIRYAVEQYVDENWTPALQEKLESELRQPAAG